jgi:hypothetical protein
VHFVHINLVDAFAEYGLADADAEAAVETEVRVQVAKVEQVQRWSPSKHKSC